MSTNTVIFDALAYVKKLTDAGVEQSAAEAIAHGQVEFLSQNVATKVVLAELETRLTTAIANSQFKIIVTLLGAMTAYGALLLASFKLL